MTTRSGRSYKERIVKSMAEEEGRKTPELTTMPESAMMMEMLREQHKLMLELLEQQRRERAAEREQQMAEMARYREEVALIPEKTRAEEGKKAEAKPRLPKPTLQKLNEEDDIEHFLETFE